jgi:hypothetical protein
MSENKDWIGNKKSTYITLGASNHTDKERQTEDYYATDPVAIDGLKSVWDIPNCVWECSCGEGHLSKRMEELGHNVTSTDLVDRGYGNGGVDFLKTTKLPNEECKCIITNPPYKYAMEFVNHSLELLKDGDYCAMFLKTTFLEGKKRYNNLFSKNPPKYMFQFSSRVLCAKNGDFETMIAGGGSAVSFAWFVWEKGYKGDTIIRWINN